MNARLAILCAILFAALYELFGGLAFVMAVVLYAVFAWELKRDPRSEHFFALGISWFVALISAVLSMGLIGFVLKQFGPFYTLFVIFACGLSVIILGLVFGESMNLLEKRSHRSLSLGLKKFAAFFIIASIAYVAFANASYVNELAKYNDVVQKQSADAKWLTQTVDIGSSQYMLDLMSRRAAVLEQIPPVGMLSLSRRIVISANDDWAYLTLDRFLREFKAIVLGALLNKRIVDTDMSAKVFDSLNASQQKSLATDFDKFLPIYVQRSDGIIYTRRSNRGSTVTVMEQMFQPQSVSEWVLLQPFEATKLHDAVFSFARDFDELIPGLQLYSSAEWARAQVFDARSRVVAELAITQTLLGVFEQECKNNKDCDNYETLKRYQLSSIVGQDAYDRMSSAYMPPPENAISP